LIGVEQLEEIYDYYQKKYTNEEIMGYTVFDQNYKSLGCNKKLVEKENNVITKIKKGIIIIVLIQNHCYELRYPGMKPSSISMELSPRAKKSKLDSLVNMKITLKDDDDSEEDDDDDEDDESEEEEKKMPLIKVTAAKPLNTRKDYPKNPPLFSRKTNKPVEQVEKVEKVEPVVIVNKPNNRCKTCGKEYRLVHNCKIRTILSDP
jgi:hypothetical protein